MASERPFSVIDSHCHIDMPQFDADRDAVVARAREAGVSEMLVVGGVDEASGHRRALEVGFFISFSGIVAFPRAEVIQQVAREVPDDRLLVETDAPYLGSASAPGEGTSPPSWWTWRGRWPPCAAPPPRPSGASRTAATPGSSGARSEPRRV